MAGAMLAWVSPVPDILSTGDGRHVGVVTNGKVHLLRTRTGDSVRDLMSGVTAVPDIMPLQDSRFARCGRDSCVADIWEHGRRLRLLATPRSVFIAPRRFRPACAGARIVVAHRTPQH